MSIWSDPTQVSQIHSTSLPSRPSDVSQSTADAAALQEVVHGDVWAQLGTCPDLARLQQTPARIGVKNPPACLRVLWMFL